MSLCAILFDFKGIAAGVVGRVLVAPATRRKRAVGTAPARLAGLGEVLGRQLTVRARARKVVP
jgi:hypothetical protein